MKSRCLVALDSTNISKNRYTDVIPFDNNRVVLDPCKDYRPLAKGYVNASFIAISEGVSRFIATQGPLAHTFEDFWEMIIQQRCPVIVMLTRLVDNYKTTWRYLSGEEEFRLDYYSTSFELCANGHGDFLGLCISTSSEVAVWTAYILPSPDPTLWEYTGFVVVVVDVGLANSRTNSFEEGESDVHQRDATSRRLYTRSQAKDLAFQALWMKVKFLEGCNMDDLKIFNIPHSKGVIPIDL
ncbi:putative protein-tyrosine-phosphatase PTP1-like isoform X2 [Capsicum annuum]|nr:putative protein-tyrosine-phosphatase PTP1-like isoform X2 [Capsicum annuum]